MRRLRIALGVLLGLLVVGVTVIGLLVGRGISSLSRPLPPPGAYARSTRVQRADGAATRWQDGEFFGLARWAPWLAPAGRSVLDFCLAEGGVGLFGGTAPEYSCSRTESRYYAYGGSDQARLRELDRVLRRLGWGQFTRDSPAGAGSPPNVAAEALAGSTALVSGAKYVVLGYSWIVHGTRLDTAQEMGALGPPASRQRAAYLERSASSQQQIARRLTAARPHLLIVLIDVNYATKPLGHP